MNKAAVKRRLVFLAGTLDPIDLGVAGRSAEAVPARYDYPGDDVGDTCIYFAGAEPPNGEAGPAAISARQPSEDVFDVNGTVDAYGFDTAEQAEEAAERIFNAFDARLSAWQRLVDPDNPETPGSTPEWSVQSAYVTSTSLLSGKGDGDTWGGRYTFAVRCKTHLRF